MATPPQVSALKAQAALLDDIQREKLTRSNLGEESLAAELEPRLLRIQRLKLLATEYADGVHDGIVSQMANVFTQLSQLLSQQAARTNPDFISQRQPFYSRSMRS